MIRDALPTYEAALRELKRTQGSRVVLHAGKQADEKPPSNKTLDEYRRLLGLLESTEAEVAPFQPRTLPRSADIERLKKALWEALLPNNDA